MIKIKKTKNESQFLNIPTLLTGPPAGEAGKQIPKYSNQGVSLVLTLLIISSILTGTLLVAETTIRHSQVVKGAEVSEKAYFGAKSALEKGAYEILKNYDAITSLDIDESFSDDTFYTATASVDTECPNPGTECSAGAINASNEWVITLSAGESFDLDLDINGVTYPNSIEIDYEVPLSGTPTDLILYQCQTEGTPRVCSSGLSQTLYVSLPQTITTSGYANNFYYLRINNKGASSEDYTLTPTGDLPIGIKIDATGTYSDYKRILQQRFPKWQKYGN